jgi:hypothetical protein
MKAFTKDCKAARDHAKKFKKAKTAKTSKAVVGAIRTGGIVVKGIGSK